MCIILLLAEGYVEALPTGGSVSLGRVARRQGARVRRPATPFKNASRKATSVGLHAWNLFPKEEVRSFESSGHRYFCRNDLVDMPQVVSRTVGKLAGLDVSLRFIRYVVRCRIFVVTRYILNSHLDVYGRFDLA